MIARGTPDFRRTMAALFAAGFATFALLYCVQPLLPAFSAAFGVDPARSSLVLSSTTGTLAVAMLVSGGIAERAGRKPVMVGSLFASSALALATALPTHFGALVLLRAAMGVALSGLPAISMAYVSEEMAPEATGLAMGLFIGGSGLGGMAGRLIASLVAEYRSWHEAVALIGALGLVSAAILARALPPSRHFVPRRLDAATLAAAYAAHFRDPALRALYAEGFLLMGGFVTLYNYAAYRLAAPPYGLGQAALGALFSVYLVGVATSAIAGNLALVVGRRRVFWGGLAAMIAGLALTLAAAIAPIIAGVALLTAGFFAAHSVASAWVGHRAKMARAQASSLYLFSYYAGSSLAGWAGGHAWQAAGWNGVAAFIAALLALAAVLSRFLPERPSKPADAMQPDRYGAAP